MHCSPSPPGTGRCSGPGYTHQRRAMPSSVGLWAGAFAEGVLDTVGGAGRALAGCRPVTARQRGGVRRPAAAQARGRGAGAGLRGPGPQRGDGAGRPRQARGGRALLVHPARTRTRAALAGRDPVQRRGVRVPGPAGRAGDRVEHHAAQAQSRSVRAHSRPHRGARGRPDEPAPDQGQARRRVPARLPAAEGAADARAGSHGGDAGDPRGRPPAARRKQGALCRGARGRSAGDRRGDAAGGAGAGVSDRLSRRRRGARGRRAVPVALSFHDRRPALLHRWRRESRPGPEPRSDPPRPRLGPPGTAAVRSRAAEACGSSGRTARATARPS